MNAQETAVPLPESPKVLRFPEPSQSDLRLVVPREHGAWALWLLPLISGGIAGYFSAPRSAVAPALWFSLVAVCAFLVHQPLETLLDVSVLRLRSLHEQRVAVFWVMGLTAMASLGVLELLRLHRGLIFVFAGMALSSFALGALFGRTRSLRVSKQHVGALGLTSTAAGAYYVTTGRIDGTALLLWLATWLFASSQIEYVQLRLHTANVNSRLRKIKAGWKVCFLHLLLLGAAISIQAVTKTAPLFNLLFVPAAVRLVVWMLRPARPLRLYLLGMSELFQSILFNALLTGAFLMHAWALT
ncbi:MAG TPA: YwiC-like family protein [Candidatus Angelobacter sp.]|nr:YwiC-like family protein [Candidatus Angelobacter sp.]